MSRRPRLRSLRWLALAFAAGSAPLQAAPSAQPTPAPTPSAVATPEPTPAERTRLRALLNWPKECEDAHQSATKALDLESGRVRSFDLGNGRQLVEVGCLRAAYQERHRYFLLDGSSTPPTARALKLPTYELDADEHWQSAEAEELAGDSSFDLQKRTLLISTRARGLGDCGRRALYRVDSKAAKLALVELRGRACDADFDKAPPADQWPVVFPTAKAATSRPTPSRTPKLQ